MSALPRGWRLRALAVVLAAVALGMPHAAGPARADLVGPRDVTRALAALEDEDDEERRARAARWLASHGDDEAVVPALIGALADEERLGTLVAISLAVARRARAEDAPRLLELEPTLRAAARAPVVVALAQLGTDETDAWLVTRLATHASSDLRPAVEQAAEIARQRRDAILPRVLEALAASPAPPLVEWLISLEDERTRAALLTLAASEGTRGLALDGLARLGPDADTATRLRELVASAGSAVSPALARALVAADPRAGDLTAILEAAGPEVRAAALDALTRLGPARAVALLGPRPEAMREQDRHVLAIARSSPAPALAPWLMAQALDPSVPELTREEALEALVRIPACDADLAGVESALVPLAEARLARVCPGRAAPAPGDDLVSLHLRAIAGEDVGALLAARHAGAATSERLAIAHAWLSSATHDDALLAALDAEPDAEVFAVLATAATRGPRRAAPARWADRLEDPRTRQAALWLASAIDQGSLPPRVARAIVRALSDPDPATRAAALRASSALPGGAPRAHACAALEHRAPIVRRAAWSVLPPDAPCVLGRARVDPELRAFRASPRGARDERGIAVLRVVGVGDGPLPRISLERDDGTSFLLRPAAHGILAVPGMGAVATRVVLDEEPRASRER